ncbi:MAG: lipid-A-disaccharide synthase [Planctomycetota bacterium]|nr:MAG: lipid-A-disaccharide synthase [Planctomycetota bacterium]
MPDAKPIILFTAFEPSGDDHASAVIAALKRDHPDADIRAWGGPRMRDAGAEIIARTGDDAVMGMPGLAKIREHKRINADIARWVEQHRPTVHVPVDSPAANFPVCAITKRAGAKVVHLVAPQLWAWGPWRIKKLRRLTDHVLCLLPFEEKWFRDRGVPATFIGHPLFDHAPDTETLDAAIADWPDGHPKIALMPGSRPGEMRANFALLLNAYNRLAREHPGMRGIVAATKDEVVPVLRRLAKDANTEWPESLEVRCGATDAVVRWCDLALVVSGTVTLQIARQRRPMVIVYKSSRLLWALIARWIIRTPFFTLPNLVAGREIVPELVPHFTGADPVADRAVALLESPDAAEAQRRDLAEIASRFEGHHAADEAAAAIARFAGLGPSTPAATGESRVAYQV